MYDKCKKRMNEVLSEHENILLQIDLKSKQIKNWDSNEKNKTSEVIFYNLYIFYLIH